MIEYDTSIFVHIPKTGGTFLRHAMDLLQSKELIPMSKEVYFWHCGLSDIDTRDKPAFVSVRDPIGWYKSWMLYFGRHGRPDPVYAAFSNNYSLTFNETLANALEPSAEIFDKIAENMENERLDGAHVAFYPEDFQHWKKEEGFYSFLTRRILDRDWDTQGENYSNIDIIGKDLSDGLLKVSAKYFIEPDEKFKARVRALKKVNTKFDDVEIILTKENEDLILEKDKFILDLLATAI